MQILFLTHKLVVTNIQFKISQGPIERGSLIFYASKPIRTNQ